MSNQFMDENTNKPCWNITAWALAGFALVLCAFALINGAGPEVVANIESSS